MESSAKILLSGLLERSNKKKNTLEPYLVVQHLRKLISLFHKKHPDKPTATFKVIDIVLPMAKPIIRPIIKPTKWKQGRPAKNANKRARRN